MLFKPRRPRSLLFKARNALWPRAGWRRTFFYLRHRVVRLPGTPHSIAAGLACGIAISFTPLLGFHFLAAVLLAWVVRGNLVASAVGTLVGNFWTLPLFWFWSFKVGVWILGGEPGVTREFALQEIRDNIAGVFVPMLVGSIPSGIVVWFATYYPLKYVIRSYQTARRHRLERLGRRRRTAGVAHAGKELP